VEQPEDRADRGTRDPAAGSPRRDPGDDLPRPGDPGYLDWVTELDEAEAAPCTGARGCPVHPEPEEYDAYIDWLRAH
jgi:hypothetical protein